MYNQPSSSFPPSFPLLTFSRRLSLTDSGPLHSACLHINSLHFRSLSKNQCTFWLVLILPRRAETDLQRPFWSHARLRVSKIRHGIWCLEKNIWGNQTYDMQFDALKEKKSWGMMEILYGIYASNTIFEIMLEIWHGIWCIKEKLLRYA